MNTHLTNLDTQMRNTNSKRRQHASAHLAFIRVVLNKKIGHISRPLSAVGVPSARSLLAVTQVILDQKRSAALIRSGGRRGG